MTYPLTFVELFAGVGGLSLGLEMAGWKCLGHAEWEDFPRRVLKHRWPEIPLWGDVSTLNGHEMVAEVGPFTMLTFGAPCQDFSVAGKREGLDGQRSVLVLDAIRIWEQSGAPLALYENVVGMLSSNKGEDFGAILSTFVGARVAVPARGWRGGAGVACGPAGVAAWRTLDAQYFGVPQRRRRVFVLCSRDPRIDPAEVLSLAEGVSGHPAKGKRSRQGAPSGTGARLASESGAGWWDDSGLARLRAQGGGSPQNVVYGSDAAQGLAINISNGEPRIGDVMGTLQARATSGGVGSGAQMNAVLAFPIQNPESGNKAQNGTGIGDDGDPMYTLESRGHGVVAFDSTFGHNANVFENCSPPVKVGSGEGIASPPAVLAFDAYNQQVTGEITMSLRTGGDSDNVPIAFDATIDKQTGLVSEGVAPTLKTDLAHQMGPVVATYEWHGQDSRVREIDVAASLNRNAEGREGHLVLEVAPVVGVDGERNPVRDGVIGPLNTGSPSGGGQHPIVVATPVTAFKIRGGVDVDSAGKQAGKGYLGSEEMALTLGTTQDQHLFDTRITATVMSSGQANAELVQDGAPSLTTLHEAPILFPPPVGVPRRLTPLECERLMGWPDGWTDVPDAKGKPAPDTARYKACGNGVASPVSAWIGFQLKAVLTKDTL